MSSVRSGLRRTDECLVLCYHAIDPNWPSELAVHPDSFRHQISRLLRSGYESMTFTEAVTGEGPARRLAVTFDDGYASVATHAAPILEELGAVGTTFVTTSFVGETDPMSWPGVDQWAVGPHSDALRPIDWLQLKELVDAGWEVGSHTRTHRMLTMADQVEMDAELSGSRSDIEEQVGALCLSIAYPYGEVNPLVIEAARRAGYVAGAGLHSADASPSALNWPRISVYPADDRRFRFRLKTSTMVRGGRDVWIRRFGA